MFRQPSEPKFNICDCINGVLYCIWAPIAFIDRIVCALLDCINGFLVYIFAPIAFIGGIVYALGLFMREWSHGALEIDWVDDLLGAQIRAPWWAIPIQANIKAVITFLFIGFDMELEYPPTNRFSTKNKIKTMMKNGARVAMILLVLNAYYKDMQRIKNQSYDSWKEMLLAFPIVWITSPNFAAARVVWRKLIVQSPIATLGIPADYTTLPTTVLGLGSVGFPLFPASALWLDAFQWMYAVLLLPYAVLWTPLVILFEASLYVVGIVLLLLLPLGWTVIGPGQFVIVVPMMLMVFSFFVSNGFVRLYEIILYEADDSHTYVPIVMFKIWHFFKRDSLFWPQPAIIAPGHQRYLRNVYNAWLECGANADDGYNLMAVNPPRDVKKVKVEIVQKILLSLVDLVNLELAIICISRWATIDGSMASGARASKQYSKGGRSPTSRASSLN